MPAGSCYRLDEDAGRVVVDAARPATVDAPRPSDVRPGYRLGWLFVGLEGWNAIQLGRNLPNGDPLLDVADRLARALGVEVSDLLRGGRQ